MKKDITQNTLYVKTLRGVMRGYHNVKLKSHYVDYRCYDVFSYIISGKCLYQFEDGREVVVQKGDILFMDRDTKYTLTMLEVDYEFIFCDFLFDAQDLLSGVYTPKNAEAAEQLFRKLLHTFSKRTVLSSVESLAVFYDIYALITMTANREYTDPQLKHRIEQTKEYIDRNYKDPSLSVSSLAESVNMSEGYFRKLFKNQYDFAPSQYIISVRLSRAKELLRYPLISLEECALQSGFSSLPYFCRMFKKSMGITPLQYRNAGR